MLGINDTGFNGRIEEMSGMGQREHVGLR